MLPSGTLAADGDPAASAARPNRRRHCVRRRQLGKSSNSSRRPQQIREAVRSDPALADAGAPARDRHHAGGAAHPVARCGAAGRCSPSARRCRTIAARLLLQKVAPVLMRLPEDIAIAGHTDAGALSRHRPDQLGAVHRARQRDAAAAGRRQGPGGEPRQPRSPAMPTATRCCRPIRWRRPTGASPSSCCAAPGRLCRRRPCRPRRPHCRRQACRLRK